MTKQKFNQKVKERVDGLKVVLKSPEGKNAMIFLAFLAIAGVLWIVQSLNEETQIDFRCPVKITNVPDSLVRVSSMPEAISVSVRGRGTQFIQYLAAGAPTINIDYRTHRNGNKLQFGDAAIKALSRNVFGGGCQVQSVTPDSISIVYTSQPGVLLPVRNAIKVIPYSQYVLVGRPQVLTDSAMVYAVNGIKEGLTCIYTEPIVFNDMRKSQVVKVPLATKSGMRAIPDSVEVSIEIEPLISKTRSIPITPINVPDSLRLIAVPATVEVYYMVPMSTYKKSDSTPKFTVVADYRTISRKSNDRIAIELTQVPKDFINVFLSTDSVDYILERQ